MICNNRHACTGQYYIPVYADIPELNAIFAGEKEERINEPVVKGVGRSGW